VHSAQGRFEGPGDGAGNHQHHEGVLAGPEVSTWDKQAPLDSCFDLERAAGQACTQDLNPNTRSRCDSPHAPQASQPRARPTPQRVRGTNESRMGRLGTRSNRGFEP